MTVYAVSFTLASDSTYGDRYDSLMKQVRAKGKIWEETTSFALVETSESLSDFEIRLYVDSDFNATKDLMVVIAVTGCNGICRGKNALSATLSSIAPEIEQK